MNPFSQTTIIRDYTAVQPLELPEAYVFKKLTDTNSKYIEFKESCVTLNRMLKREGGLWSDTKGRFYALVVLSHFCMEVKCVLKTNQGVTGPVAETAQCEVNTMHTANDQVYGR
jgi:hypothetical protein